MEKLKAEIVKKDKIILERTQEQYGKDKERADALALELKTVKVENLDKDKAILKQQREIVDLKTAAENSSKAMQTLGLRVRDETETLMLHTILKHYIIKKGPSEEHDIIAGVHDIAKAPRSDTTRITKEFNALRDIGYIMRKNLFSATEQAKFEWKPRDLTYLVDAWLRSKRLEGIQKETLLFQINHYSVETHTQDQLDAVIKQLDRTVFEHNGKYFGV